MRTLAEECLWLKEWSCPFELSHAREFGVPHYNEYYLYSALGYKPPRQFEQQYQTSYGT
jgi:transposase InsO family protein